VLTHDRLEEDETALQFRRNRGNPMAFKAVEAA
jgi:hypothetical protein